MNKPCDRNMPGSVSPANPLPMSGYLRLRHIIGDPKANPPIPPIIPISKSSWWQGVKELRYPQPVRTLGKRITAWRVEDIRDLLARLDDTSTSADGGWQ